MKLKKPYVISVYALIRNEKGEYLLLKRSENSRTNPGKWDLPGGKVDRGETLKEAVAREVQEETGISINPGGIAGEVTFELPAKKVIAIVYDGGFNMADVQLSYEHMEYTWTPLEKIVEMEALPHYFRNFFKEHAIESLEASRSSV
ncbi:GDP-mannose mannosyl hydrolase [Methanosarcina sp. MTP4]|uniref:NUDIX hydrolase n=1 Tax=Methanosarcina sp. MTP4 TaxID=1434100 RepID=UPI0006156682|nr:NUDIX domain-containing protein [Methanosarcina sp. MTP4]AKB23913.1 GDP-mannose mannosyl hydrolase [Methanosarcina sp. MTP4]